MRKQKKLLIVGSFLAEERGVFGGIARSCQTMMQSSFSERFKIIPVDSTQASNPPPGLLMRILLALRRMIVFLRQILQSRPDGVLLFTSVGMSFLEKSIMGWISRFLRCPVLIFPRGGRLIEQAEQSGLMRHLFRVLLKGSRVFLAQGPRWHDFAVNVMGFDASNVYVIPNWTATERHLNIGARRKFNLSNNQPRLLFVGWLEEFKGVFELLNACHKMAGKGIDFRLTLAGRGHAEAEARQFVEKNKLEDIVTFAGWAEAEKLEELYSSHDIFVLPSWAEGMPNSMIEAMATGLAVIVTKVGMVGDFLQNEEHALLIPPQNEQLLEKALQRIILDPELRNKLANNGYCLSKNKFAVEPAMLKFGDIVEATIAK